MKKISFVIALVMIGLSVVGLFAGCSKNTTSGFSDEINLPSNSVIYDSSDLTYEILSSRTSDITIVERIVGVVLDENGNGRVLDSSEPCNYISYKYVPDIMPGDIVITYSVFNPENQFEDDIIARYDMVVARDDVVGY